jgi:MFS family permease
MSDVAETLETAIPEVHRPVPARHILAATIGNGLEFYDFTVYAYFATQIGHAFFPAATPLMSTLESLAVFGIGFVFRPVGGLVLGMYGDRIGRRPALVLSFTLMALSILALALLPSYATIGVAAPLLVILFRIVQGFALGGEVGSTNAFLLEAAPVESRGLFATFQGASQNVAGIIGGGVGVILSVALDVAHLDTYGWRIAFVLGALTLPFGVILRRSLPETLHRKETFTTHASVDKDMSVVRTYGRSVVLLFFIFASGTIGTYVFGYMTTYARSILNMDPLASFAVTVVSNLAGLVAGVAAGWYSDTLGRRPVMIWSRLLMIVATFPIFLLIVREHSAFVLLAGIGFLSFLSSASQAPTYAVLGESMPKSVRATGFAVVYAMAISIFGGSAQPIIHWIIITTGNKLAPAWYLLVASTIGLVAMILIEETAPSKVHGLPPKH